MDNSFEFLEEDAVDAPVKNIKWEGKEVGTPDSILQNDGSGQPIILRTYKFAFNPELKGRPTKEQILTPEYKQYLNKLLWADELRMVLEPKVAINEKEFVVYATCQPRTGATILEKPKLIQEYAR